MEDLGIDEVKQLVNFYRQKSSDLEFQVLQLQLRLNKALVQKSSFESEKSSKVKSKS